MKKIILLLTLITGLSIQADMIEPLDSLAITCTEEVGFLAVMPNKIEIDFFEDTMYVTLNGEEKKFNTILKAGTEGRDPYIQFVANGFVNFIITGPMLNDAFDGRDYVNRPYPKGALFISVDNLRERQPDFTATCSGYLAF